MTYEEFVTQRITVPPEEMEPFCPFGIAYCNDAYTKACYSCENSRNEYAAATQKETLCSE